MNNRLDTIMYVALMAVLLFGVVCSAFAFVLTSLQMVGWL